MKNTRKKNEKTHQKIDNNNNNNKKCASSHKAQLPPSMRLGNVWKGKGLGRSLTLNDQ